MADPTNPTPAATEDPASAWYLSLLEREATAAGRPVSAAALADNLRLLPASAAAPGMATDHAVLSRLSHCSVRQNALDGEPLSWYLDFLATGGDESMPRDAALALATRVAAPPDDAVLEGAGYETMADRCVFRARWRHEMGGVPVEGDYIEVLVNGRHQKAFSLAKVWRQPRVGQGPAER